MLCTASPGGMRSVVEGYLKDGVFDRHAVELIFTHDQGSVAHRLALAWRALWHVLGVLRRQQADLLHIHMAMRGSFWRKSLFASMARAYGVPVVAHLHGSEFKQFYASQPAWRQRLIVGQLEAASQVLVLSRSWQDFITGIAPGARVVVLPNYVRLPEVDELARRQPASGDTVRFLFLGAVGKRKGIYDLIPAFAEALKRVPSAQLRIGGTGEVEQARKMAQSLGIEDRVVFLGWVSGADKERELAMADAYVLPSHNEGLPMSLLEAMSWRLPVVSTRVGGIPELVRHGIDGLLIEPGDVAALTDALTALASDPDRRSSLGEAGRTHVAGHYSDAVVLPVLERIYSESRRRVTAQP